MLVGTFKIKIGRLAETTFQQHAFVGHAGVEPHVEDVADFFVVSGLIAQQLGGVQCIPDVHAALLHLVGNHAHQFHRARMRLAGFAMHEQRDRHAPGALAADAPVRAAFHHAGDARLAPGRVPLHVLDGGQRIAAQVGLLHRDEPLRRGAEHHRRAMTPAMRIAVLQLEEGKQGTAFAQHLDDGVVGFPDMQAGQDQFACRRRGRQVHTASVDRIHLRGGVFLDQAVFLADHEVFLAMARRGVHGTGTVFGGDVVTQDHRDLAVGVERMVQHHTFQRTALGMRMHHEIGNPVALRSTLSQGSSQHQPATLAVVRRAFNQHVIQVRTQRHRQ